MFTSRWRRDLLLGRVEHSAAIWCDCSGDGEHLAPIGCSAPLVISAVAALLTSAPRAPLVASSHRTTSTTHSCEGDGWCQYTHPDRREARPIATPLGTTSRFFSPI